MLYFKHFSNIINVRKRDIENNKVKFFNNIILTLSMQYKKTTTITTKTAT